MNYTPPAAYSLTGAYPVGVRAGDTDNELNSFFASQDNPTSLNPLVIGAAANGGGTALTNFTAVGNPYFFNFRVGPSAPVVTLNNIPVTGCCRPNFSRTVCVGAVVNMAFPGVPGATPYVSSNTGIFTVNNTGQITAISAGVATLTYNAASGCQTVVTITVSNCGQLSDCNCTDKIYLNDTGLNQVEKFSVTSSNGALTMIGNPWLDNIKAPHGIGSDLNGNVYVGEVDFATPSLNIQKLNCQGQKLDAIPLTPPIDNMIDNGFSFNHFTIGNYLYVNLYSLDPSAVPPYDFSKVTTQGEVAIYDVCTGVKVGCQSSAYMWGFTKGNDGYWYGTSSFSNTTTRVVRGPLDPATFTTGTCNPVVEDWIVEGIDFPDLPTNTRFQGITTDDEGNIYVVASGGGGFQPPSTIYKFSPSKVLLATSLTDSNIESNVSDGLNWAGARGIIWSPNSGKLYVSTIDDCIAAFNTSDLSYDPVASNHTPAPAGSFAKGIGITTECCPIPANALFDVVLCNVPVGTPYFFQDLVSACPGALCEGTWLANPGSVSGVTLDACNVTATTTAAEACGTLTLSSRGAQLNSTCGPFDLTVRFSIENIVAPVLGNPIAVACNGDPAEIPVTTVASATGAISYQWQQNTDGCNGTFSDIPGATAATYNPPAGAMANTYYRVITSVPGCIGALCRDTSNCVLQSVTPISLTNPQGTQTICVGETGTALSVQTDQNAANSIRFVRFGSDQTLNNAAPTVAESNTVYTMGTTIGTVTPAGASAPYTATLPVATANLAGLAAGTYYFYAVVEPDLGTSDCQPLQEIIVTVDPAASITVNSPVPACEGATVDLANFATPLAGTALTFHTTQADADAGTNALVNTTVVASNTTYYARATTSLGCYATAPIVVVVEENPDLVLVNGVACPNASVDLNTLVTDADGGTLSFYSTLANAQAGTNALPSSTVTLGTNAANYFVRSTTANGCFTVGQITLSKSAPVCGVILTSGPN